MVVEKKDELEEYRMKAAEMGLPLSVDEKEFLQVVNRSEELYINIKKELLEFLELSDYYDAAEILQSLGENQFLEERAVCNFIIIIIMAIINRLFCLKQVSISMHWRLLLINLEMWQWQRHIARRFTILERMMIFSCI